MKRTTWKKHLLLCIVSVFLFGVVGCGGMNKPAVSKRYYDIGPERAGIMEAGQGRNSGEVLTVRRLRVSPMNAGREMVYRTSDTGYTSDFYHAYFIPPADMLSQALRKWLHAANLYSHVVEPASLVRGDLVLEGNVVALYGDFAGSGEAVAELQFILLDEGKAETSIVFSKDYIQRIPLAAQTPQALAAGLKQAMGSVYAELEKDLAAAMK